MWADFATHFAAGLVMLFQPDCLLACLVGMVVGIIFGVLPGIGASSGLAILFPFTFGMSTQASILLLLSAYTGCEYGGSITSITINIPGNAAAAVTCLDGYPLAKKGFARKALMISLWSGFVAGILSTIAFIVLATPLAWFALRFGPPEMFAVSLFGLSIISSLTGKSTLKGLIAVSIGLFIGVVGTDPFSGFGRFAFERPYLMDGIPLAVGFVGIFAIPEVIRMLEEAGFGETGKAESVQGKGLSFAEFKRLFPSMLRGSIIGTFVGIIPGLGTAIASFIAYNEEKRWSKRPADFGTGVEEGVASPEASNNAVVCACLIPSLALGIPGSASAAMFVGLLILKGIVPGPLMFEKSGPLIMLIFAGLILINFYMLAVSYLGLRISTAIAEVPAKLLGPFVFILCLTGVYAYGGSFYHVLCAFLIGVFCWLLEKIEIPVIPIALGMVMQNLIEENLIGSLMIHQGDFSVFFTRPISAVVITIAVFVLILGFWRERTHAGRGEARV